MYNTNVDGTANVVNLSLENGVKKLVHISSISALGRTSAGEQVNEEKKWMDSKLNSHYGISKNKAEMEVWRGMGEGLDAVIINPSTVLGFGTGMIAVAPFLKIHTKVFHGTQMVSMDL
jgi:nucleoside-diphosphate-sugar epimerase